MGKRNASTDGFPAVGLGPGARHGGRPGARQYHATRAASWDGRSFASKAERDRYHELILLQQAGEIKDLERQPLYHFSIAGEPLCIPVGKAGRWQRTRYTGDFRYIEVRTGRLIVEDVKGWPINRDLGLRLGLMKLLHGIEVRLVQPRKLR